MSLYNSVNEDLKVTAWICCWLSIFYSKYSRNSLIFYFNMVQVNIIPEISIQSFFTHVSSEFFFCHSWKFELNMKCGNFLICKRSQLKSFVKAANRSPRNVVWGFLHIYWNMSIPISPLIAKFFVAFKWFASF